MKGGEGVMGYYVHIHTVFACDNNDSVATLAKKHLDSVQTCDIDEAKWFLEDLSKRTGNNFGIKGGLSLWGMVGNYTNGQGFAIVLKPFWLDLLTLGIDDGDWGGPLYFEHILIFVEPEQSNRMTAYEIYLSENAQDRAIGEDKHTFNQDDLIIKEHKELPFCIYQM